MPHSILCIIKIAKAIAQTAKYNILKGLTERIVLVSETLSCPEADGKAKLLNLVSNGPWRLAPACPSPLIPRDFLPWVLQQSRSECPPDSNQAGSAPGSSWSLA